MLAADVVEDHFPERRKKVLFCVCREQNALQASAHAGLAHAVRLI